MMDVLRTCGLTPAGRAGKTAGDEAGGIASFIQAGIGSGPGGSADMVFVRLKQNLLD
jgi:hypothetical protein